MIFKVLGPNGEACHGGRGQWPLPKGKKPGAWLEVEGALELCSNGLHGVPDSGLSQWYKPGVKLYAMEGDLTRGVAEDGHKVAFKRARLLYEITEGWPLLKLYPQARVFLARLAAEGTGTRADLSWANLSWADLSKANLSWANLSEANLSTIRNDFWAVLLFAKNEVQFLRQSLIDGKVDGSVYTGECACLVGTIAKAKECDVEALPLQIQPNSYRAAERFFMGIKKGDTPETNPVSKIALEWTDIWLEQMK